MERVQKYAEDKSIWGFMYNGLTKVPGEKKTKREASFELLRIISMMMVIILHYISKGELIDLEGITMGQGKYGFWILESMSIVAVNVFVIISGYFMAKSSFSIYKIIGIWCQVLFYSVTGALVAVIAGIYSLSDLLCLKNILFFLFPVTNGHYWFATAYIIMYLSSPVIVMAMEKLDRKTLETVIIALLSVFCFLPSISPFSLATDDRGNSFVWFILLFIIAGYIRIYGLKILDRFSSSFALYGLSVCLIVLTRSGLCIFANQHSGYEYLPTVVTHYNFIFVLTASLGLFGIFKNIHIKEGLIADVIVKISPFVFGVYLLHEHLTLRYIWLQWFKVNNSYGPLRVIHILLTVIIIFTLGIIIDVLRSLIFILCKKLMLVCLNIYFAKQEMWDYLVFGLLATVVNWVAYIACSYSLLIPLITDNDKLLKTTGNVIAWVVAVLFAYWTNRNFVFKSRVTGAKEIFKEFMAFVGSRIFSFVVEQGMFLAFIMMNISDIIGKIIIGVVVIILNFIFSKLLVFRKKKRE